jgi:ATP-binding cassette subfamily C protein CydD
MTGVGAAQGASRAVGPAASQALSSALSGRPFDRRLVHLPGVRASLAASVGLGLLSTAGVVAQALGLAHLLAAAMPRARAGAGLRAQWFVLLGAGFAVRALAALAGEVVAAWGSSAAKGELRSRLVAQAAFSQEAHSARREGPGSLAALAGPGLDALDVYLGRCLPDFVLAAAAPAALLVAVGVIDWVSALIALSVLALFPVFGALVGRASLALGTDRWRRVELLGAYVTDVFEGMPVLRAFGRSRAQRDRIAKLNEALARSSTKALRVAFLSALVLDELGSISVALVAVPLGLRLLSGAVTLPAALAVLAISPEVFAPLRRASAEFHESTEGLAAAAQALGAAGAGEVGAPVRHLGREEGPIWPEGGAPTQGEACPSGPRQQHPAPGPGLAPVALRSVSVVLPGRATPLLEGVNLTIEPGETVVLVGPSGSGKSTIISLLAGFLSPSQGSVTAGAVDLREVGPRYWRRFVTYLPEHPTLLSATLAANLRLAAPSASDEQLFAALQQAGALALASSLPGGLEARLGEGGRRLSAGELQRVALARVLLRPASLYLLDEPTVHLDEASEQEVLASLQKAIGGASALIVSHRPAVALAADRVVSLREGSLVEVAKANMLTAVPA